MNARLLNEFLKEHRTFIEEQLKVADQQTQIDALKEELKNSDFSSRKSVTDRRKPINEDGG